MSSSSPVLRRLLTLALTVAFAAVLTVTTAGTAEARGIHLHRGSHGPSVRVLETRLQRLGLLPASAVDVRYRQATVNAVRRFQRGHHLRPNGRVDARVWNLVARAVRARAVTPTPKPPPPPPPPTGPPPAIVGHRGETAPDAPENTLVAMQHAATSASVLEFDLHLTADHQLVLLHDATLDRTTNCTGRVIDWTLANLRAQCRAGTQPVPTFEEVAAYAATTTLKIAPEIKNLDISDADLAQVFATVDAHGLASRTILQSFTPAILQRVHALRPDLRLMLVALRPMTVAAARESGATTVAVALENLTSAQVAAYRSSGLRVWTYTAIDLPTLDQAHRIHVDAVITDVPGLARAHYGS